MLTVEYFNGSREKEISFLCSQFLQGNFDYLDINAKTVHIRESDLMVHINVYERFVTTYPQYEACFIPFCHNSVSIPYRYYGSGQDRANVQLFRYYSGGENDHESEYEIPFRVMSAFMESGMYTEDPDFEKFDQLLRADYPIPYVLPSQRCALDDGQLKIVMDVVLAIDAVDEEVINGLVVGSSHPGYHEGSLAYDCIALMGKKGRFDLYDVYNESVQEIHGELEMNYVSGNYDYSFNPYYDIILDDAWQEGKKHIDFDPDLTSFTSRHYSVKKFPKDDYGVDATIYHQVFSTEGREQRYVSRPLIWNYRSLPVGDCPACTELKFLLKGDYDSSFYEYFMSCHRSNCITKQMRVASHTFNVGVKRNDFKIYRATADISGVEFRTMPWDPVPGYEPVGMDPYKLRTSNVIFRSYKYVHPKVLYYSPWVLIRSFKCKPHGEVDCCESHSCHKDYDCICQDCELFRQEGYYLSSRDISYMGFKEYDPGNLGDKKLRITTDRVEGHNAYRKRFGGKDVKNKNKNVELHKTPVKLMGRAKYRDRKSVV